MKTTDSNNPSCPLSVCLMFFAVSGRKFLQNQYSMFPKRCQGLPQKSMYKTVLFPFMWTFSVMLHNRTNFKYKDCMNPVKKPNSFLTTHPIFLKKATAPEISVPSLFKIFLFFACVYCLRTAALSFADSQDRYTPGADRAVWHLHFPVRFPGAASQPLHGA